MTSGMTSGGDLRFFDFFDDGAAADDDDDDDAAAANDEDDSFGRFCVKLKAFEFFNASANDGDDGGSQRNDATSVFDNGAFLCDRIKRIFLQ